MTPSRADFRHAAANRKACPCARPCCWSSPVAQMRARLHHRRWWGKDWGIWCDHATFKTTDRDVVHEFYRQLLGLRPAGSAVASGRVSYAGVTSLPPR